MNDTVSSHGPLLNDPCGWQGRGGHGVHVHVRVVLSTTCICSVIVLEVLRRFPCAWQLARPGSAEYIS